MALRNTRTVARAPASPAQSGSLSMMEVGRVAYAAGFRGDRLTTAIAVALAESGGNPKIVSPTNDHGLWQINKAAHPQYFRVANKIYDPSYNASAAFAISKGGTNWNPWTTYTHGDYKGFIDKIPHGAGADKLFAGGTNNTGGGWVPGIPDPGDLHIGNPIKWVDEAAHTLFDFLHIIIEPEKLGRWWANVIAWLIKQIAKAIYNVVILPPWRWTQRATIYYAENYILKDEVSGGQRYAIGVKAITTMGFWAMGYAILWGKFEEPELGVDPAESAFGRTIRSGHNAVAARRIVKPQDVAKKTPPKPKETVSEVPVSIVRHLSASRRRTVKVSGTGTDNGNGQQQANAEGIKQDAQNDA